jgi:hypothetical protein
MKKTGKFILGLTGLTISIAGFSIAVFNGGEIKKANASPVTLTALTGTADVVSGNSYVIAANFNSSGTEYAPLLNGGSSTFATGGITTQLKTVVDSTTKLLTFTSATGGYYLMDGANYVYATNTNNGLATGTTKDIWTIAYVSGKGFTFKEATNSRYITLYQTSNFRSYTSVYDNGASQNSYFNIYSVALASNVVPTSISLGTYSGTMTAGTTQEITATMLPATTTESVTWAVADPTIVQVVDKSGTSGGVATGVVTPLNNGTTTITATASTTTSVTVTTTTITVSGFSTSTAPATLTSTDLALSNSYATSSGDKTVDGIVYCVENAMVIASDYSKSSVVQTYEKGGIQMQSAAGFIYNKTKYAAKVQKVLVSGVTASTAIAVSGGATAKAVTSAATKTSVGLIFTYTFATPVDFFTINATNTGYMNSFTVELVGGVETTASLAAYINGLIPDRSDNTALCVGATGNYVVAQTRFNAASATVQTDFQNSTNATVVAARTRYVRWANTYGDTTPFDNTLPAANPLVFGNKSNDGSTIAVVAIAAGAALFAGAFFFLKKKEQH